MSEKIIVFVDWDGVVNNHDISFALPNKLSDKFNAQEDNPPLSPIAVGFLNKLCADHQEIRIVCSSTWRTDSKAEIVSTLKNAHKRLIAASGLEHIPYSIKFHAAAKNSWRTPYGRDFNDAIRGKEIDAWLSHYGDEKTRYIIIDDDNDFFPWQLPYFVQTDAYNGITLDDYFKLDDLITSLEPAKQMRLDFKPL
jgi:hypothetical protein